MMKRRNVLAAVLILGLPATASAGTPVGHWSAASTTAYAVTGDVTFRYTRITFAGGKSLAISKVAILPKFSEQDEIDVASIYQVSKPANLVLIAGNRLCGSAKHPETATYVVIWHTKPMGADIDPISMAVFSGKSPPHSDHDPGLCGIYNYEAGTQKR
jgi:hypothetical protein